MIDKKTNVMIIWNKNYSCPTISLVFISFRIFNFIFFAKTFEVFL